MKLTPTELDGVVLVETELFEDDRGGFARLWCKQEFLDFGLDFSPVQSNISRNARAGTLRGLHYQEAPYGEAKLMRCTRGSAQVVAVDIRPDSETVGQHIAVILSALDLRALFIPAGFANGFQTLDDDSEVLYLMSQAYVADAATGFRWDSPELAIRWPLAVSALSDRDRDLSPWPGTQS